MLTKVEQALESWQNALPRSEVSRLFVRGIYLVLLLNLLRLAPIAGMIWGSDHFMIMRDQFNGLGHLVMLLNHEVFRAHYHLFVYPLILLLILGLAGITHWTLRLLIALIYANLHFGAPELNHGGWQLMYHMLLLSVFMFRVDSEAEGWGVRAKRLMHNLAFWGVWIQISLVYGVAGIHKLIGEWWLSGDALAYTLADPEYCVPFIFDLMDGNNWLLRFGTWGVLAYQLLFPVLIWVRWVRRYLLIVGLIFHFSISFIIGFMDFGVIMAVSYLIFIPEGRADRVNQWLDRVRLRNRRAGARNITGKGD